MVLTLPQTTEAFSFVVDFGKVISGFRGVLTYYWADWTAPKEIQLECSVDGRRGPILVAQISLLSQEMLSPSSG